MKYVTEAHTLINTQVKRTHSYIIYAPVALIYLTWTVCSRSELLTCRLCRSKGFCVYLHAVQTDRQVTHNVPSVSVRAQLQRMYDLTHWQQKAALRLFVLLTTDSGTLVTIVNIMFHRSWKSNIQLPFFVTNCVEYNLLCHRKCL